MLILVFPALFVGCANGQQGFEETIKKPVLGDVISGGTVDLQFSLAGDHFWPVKLTYTVYFDGNLYVENQRTFNNGWRSLLEETLPLNVSNTTQGRHTIRVDVNLDYTVVATGLAVIDGHSETSASVDFYVYRGIQPEVSIMGPEAESDRAMFKVETNEAASAVSYSLDGATNRTLPQSQPDFSQNKYLYNLTFTGLSIGDHTLVVYTKDAFNNTASAQKAFTVGPPVLLMAGVAGATILIAVVAVLLLKRRARQKVLVKG